MATTFLSNPAPLITETQTRHPNHPASNSTRYEASSNSRHLPGLPTSTTSSVITPDLNSTTDDVAVEKHPKGKRKRTATKDKLILEEAYSSNPKPDKQARLDIVNRVSLNEKEVQIWFQNRRQNDRRKSRPLSQQELAALRFGGLHAISSDPLSSQHAHSDFDRHYPVSDPSHSQLGNDYDPSSPKIPHSPKQPHVPVDIVAETPRYTTQASHSSRQSHITPPQRQAFSPSQEPRDPQHSFSSSVGYLANRWNLGSSFSTPSTLSNGHDDSLRLEPFPPSSCSSTTSYKTSQSQSQMRLSLSLEGKAEVISDASSPIRETPLKLASELPSLPQVRQRTLQRSHSALPGVTLPPISTLTNSLPPRLIRGRSRDVHAWELCADSKTSDELTTQAEDESSGSATAAINLLRSTSNILQPIGAKRNAPVSKQPALQQVKRPKLGRTNSGIAGMESDLRDVKKPVSGIFNGKVNVSMLVSPTDSDKENWSPNTGRLPREGRRRPLSPLKLQNSRRLGRILQDQKSPTSLSRANTAPSDSRPSAQAGVEIFEDTENVQTPIREDEVSKFMRGAVSPSKRGDMDCVAGLLSLSQGAWR